MFCGVVGVCFLVFLWGYVSVFEVFLNGLRRD